MKLRWPGIRNSVMLLLLLLPGSGDGRSGGDSPPPLNQSKPLGELIRRMAEHGETAALERYLTAWQRRSPRDLRAGDHDYLLARIHERRGRRDEAATLYRQVADRGSLLAGHALRREAALAREAGKPTDEQRLLDRLLTSQPQFIAREALVARLSDTLLAEGRYEAAFDVLRRFGSPRRDALVRVAEAQAGAGWKENARETFLAVLEGSRTDEISLRAARGLDRLGAEGGPNLPITPESVLPEAARLQRARLYQFNRCFDEARRHWLALLRDFPATASRPEALFQVGRGYYLENNFRAAREWYGRVATEFPQSSEGEQGFYYLGHCAQGLAETRRAIEQYEIFLRQYPQSRFVGYAHLNAIDTLRSAGEHSAALEWARRLRARVNEPFFQVTGLFSQVRINLARQDYVGALADLDRLRSLKLNVQGLSASTSPAEVDYWRGYCLEKLRRPEEAIDVYLGLPEVRGGAEGYYGRRATIRLRALAHQPAARRRRLSILETAREARSRQEYALAKTAAAQALRFPLDPAATREMMAILTWSYGRLRGYQLPPLPATNLPEPESPRLRRATRLLDLGLADEAGPELAAADLPLATLAWYCARSECAHLTLRYSEPLLNALPADYRPELLPREWQRLFYPAPWSEDLERFAVANGVDPLLLLSIARQESRFQPRAASEAAARGILQFIVPTALAMAAEVGLPAFAPEDLFSPIVSLQLGARYVRRLKAQFTTPEMIAAAYNGSEESVRRWIERAASSEVERHVSEILKRETKAYVYSVDSNYYAYRLTGQPVGRPSGSVSVSPSVR